MNLKKRQKKNEAQKMTAPPVPSLEEEELEPLSPVEVSLANTTSQTVPNHIFSCRHCPVEIHENLELMRRAKYDPDGKRLNKPIYGGRKVFFRRVWSRIQDSSINEEGEKGETTTTTTVVNNDTPTTTTTTTTIIILPDTNTADNDTNVLVNGDVDTDHCTNAIVDVVVVDPLTKEMLKKCYLCILTTRKAPKVAVSAVAKVTATANTTDNGNSNRATDTSPSLLTITTPVVGVGVGCLAHSQDHYQYR